MEGPLKPRAQVDGRYLLVRRLGYGGFGSVWLAEDQLAKGLGGEVAVKVLHPHVKELGGNALQRFIREAEVLRRLDHPNIARALAFNIEGEHAYLAMEYVDGISLDQVIRECARKSLPLESRDLMRIFDEIAAPIAYAHAQGVVHRDLKPRNVMILRRENRLFVKILDFGVARLLEAARSDATTVGRLLGTYFYMSPEQARGEPADARSDVFALGTILFEMLTLHRAWLFGPEGKPARADLSPAGIPNNAPERVLQRICADPRPKPSDFREGLPLELDRVIAKALAIQPIERHATVDDLVKDAAPVLKDVASTTSLTVVQIETELRDAGDSDDGEAPLPTLILSESEAAPGPRSTAAFILLTALAAALAAAIAFWIASPKTPAERSAASIPAEPAAPEARPIATSPSHPEVRADMEPPKEEPASAAPRRPVRRTPEKAASKRSAPEAARSTPAVRYPDLADLLERARKDPRDLKTIAALSEGIGRAAKESLEGRERTRVERLAEQSAIDGNVDGFARCLRALEESKPR